MKKKATIVGGLPRPTRNTTGATNRTSGYLNPNAAGNKTAAPKTTVTKSGRKITATASTSGGGTSNKTFKPGSMVTQSKVVTTKPKKKTTASTSYSPAPMSAAAKAKAAAAGRAKSREYKDLPKKRS
jgi:hypothetical protein